MRIGARAEPSVYRREWLARDVIAGVVLSTLLVPPGMAFAELAGPPITGLYTSIVGLAGDAAFGPSRVLVPGPDSSLRPMIAATIVPLAGAGGDPERAAALASMPAIIVGAIMIDGAPAHLDPHRRRAHGTRPVTGKPHRHPRIRAGKELNVTIWSQEWP